MAIHIGRREFVVTLGGAAAAWPLAARAQQAGKLPVIRYFGSGTPSTDSQWVAAFVQRMRELGWVEGFTAHSSPRNGSPTVTRKPESNVLFQNSSEKVISPATFDECSMFISIVSKF